MPKANTPPSDATNRYPCAGAAGGSAGGAAAGAATGADGGPDAGPSFTRLIVVVQFHWGEEYQPLPVAAPGLAPDNPVQIGHLAIDDGADVVVGNHPHWIQPVEVYKGKLITYAHGNFIFDQTWSVDTMQGVVGTYTFYDDKLIAASWKPVQIVGWGQPTWMADAPAVKALIPHAAVPARNPRA